jgi:hypothetical protein
MKHSARGKMGIPGSAPAPANAIFASTVQRSGILSPEEFLTGDSGSG